MYDERDAYENTLRSLGCQQIGSGLYSNVFAIPNSDKVVKVARLDRWPEYIAFAKATGYCGTFAPKVYSLKFKGKGDEAFYIAIMERLVCTIGDIRQVYGECRAPTDQSAIYNSTLGYYSAGESEAIDLVEYVRKLRNAKLYNDCHDGNVMVRKDGQVVITDPCSGEFNSDPFRIKNGEFT